MTEREFLRVLKEAQGEQTIRAFADSLGVNYSYLHLVLTEKRRPSDRILKAFGYKRVTTTEIVPRRK